MRDTGYGQGDSSQDDQDEERSFELLPEEAQGLKEGEPVSVQLTGTFKDGCIYPTEVKLAPPVGADAMPAPAPQGPMMVRNNIQQVPG